MQKCPVHSCLFYYRYAFYSVNLLEKSRYASKIVWKKLNVPSTILPFSSIRFATFPIYASGCCKVGTFKRQVIGVDGGLRQSRRSHLVMQ